MGKSVTKAIAGNPPWFTPLGEYRLPGRVETEMEAAAELPRGDEPNDTS